MNGGRKESGDEEDGKSRAERDILGKLGISTREQWQNSFAKLSRKKTGLLVHLGQFFVDAVCPEVYDGLSARIALEAGAKCPYDNCLETWTA